MRKSIVAVCVLLTLIMVIVVMPGCGGSKETVTPETPTIDDSSGETDSPAGEMDVITLAEYNQVEEGMTLGNVENIIGSAGKLSKEVESSDGLTTTTIYLWPGNGGPASMAQLSFEDGVLFHKTQSGLQ